MDRSPESTYLSTRKEARILENQLGTMDSFVCSVRRGTGSNHWPGMRQCYSLSMIPNRLRNMDFCGRSSGLLDANSALHSRIPSKSVPLPINKQNQQQ